MTESPDSPPGFWAELRRRKVVRVAGMYLVVAWVAIQAAGELVPILGLPESTSRLVFLLLVIGFPIAIGLAWAFEYTEHGVRRDAGQSSAAARSLLPRGATIAVVTVLLLAGAFLAWKRYGTDAPGTLTASAPEATPSIAVLPFDNMSGEAENEYFSDGITEDILTNLSKIPGLRVISRTSVMKYKEGTKGIPEIAAELGVTHVLEGSVRRADGMVRINAQLIDASDEHLWAEMYDRKLEDVFAIQSEIAQAIAAALEARLTAADNARLATRATADMSAYDDYLKGREYYRRYTAEDNERAIALFRRAVAADPKYAEAWAGLADAIAQRANRFGYGLEWSDSALVYARKSVELRPDLAEGYKAIGLVYWVRGQMAKSLEANLEAVKRNPNYSTAIANAGYAYMAMGRPAEALVWFNRELKLQPNQPESVAGPAAPLLLLEEDSAATASARAALALQPENSISWEALLAIAIMRGDLPGARKLAEEARTMAASDIAVARSAAIIEIHEGNYAAARALLERPGVTNAPVEAVLVNNPMTALAFVMRQMGDRAGSDELIAQVLRRDETALRNGADASGYYYDLATIHVMRGNKAEALRMLAKAADTGWRNHRFGVRDPLLAPLRNEPEFQRIIGDVRSKVAAERARARREGLI